VVIQKTPSTIAPTNAIATYAATTLSSLAKGAMKVIGISPLSLRY